MLYFYFFTKLLVLNLLAAFSGATIKNATYVGCFKTSTAVSYNYGTVIKPLTWEICVNLCFYKLTIFAGVQFRNNTCFCGNAMHEESERLGQSYCEPCYGDPNKWCGGEDTLSLYRLKPTGSSPLGVLLASDKGIKMVITDKFQNTSETVQLSDSSATSIAYHYKSQTIYFVSKTGIMNLTYVPWLMKYSSPWLINQESCDNRTDLEVDWEDKRVYWACASTSKVESTTLDGKIKGFTFYKAVGLAYFAVDPYARLIFFTRSMTLSKYDFHSFNEHILDHKYKFYKVFQLAIDTQQEVVYIIGSFSENSKMCLISLSYDCTVFKVIHQGEELSSPVGLDAFNGTIVWASVKNNSYNVYRGKISPKYHLEKIAVILTETQKINALKIYHPEAQQPGPDYLCRQKNCSHNCLVISSSRVHCTCPESTRANFTSVLSSDGRTCSEIPTYKLYPQTVDYTASTPESSEPLLAEDLMSTTEITSTDYTEGSEELSAYTQMPEISTTDLNTSTSMLKEHYISTPSGILRVKLDQENNSNFLNISKHEIHYHNHYHISVPYIISCIVILFLVFTIPFQIFIAIWIRRTNRTLSRPPLVFFQRRSD